MNISQPIEFPCVIKMDQVAELEYVKNARAFERALQEQVFTAYDELIDSQLQCFRFVNNQWQQTGLAPINTLQTWLQHYAAAVGFCCSAKLVSSDASQLIELANELADS